MLVALSLPFPGVCRVFEHGERLGLWKFVCLRGDVDIPVSDHYIIGAWHDFYRDKLLNVLPESSRITVLWTSSVGEVSLEPVEVSLLQEVLLNKRVSKIWFGSAHMSRLFSDKGVYAPYPIDFDYASPRKDHGSYMTLFAPPTAKKNLFTQFAAIALLQRDRGLPLYTNVRVPEVFKINYTFHEWLPDLVYRDLISGSCLNWACSWAETLNYQALEAAVYEVPSVVSRAIGWAPRTAQVDSAGDVISMIYTAKVILGNPEYGKVFRKRALRHASLCNAELRSAIESF